MRKRKRRTWLYSWRRDKAGVVDRTGYRVKENPNNRQIILILTNGVK